MNHYGIEIKAIKDHGTSRLYTLKNCVFNPEHSGGGSAIGQRDNGTLFYQCFHNSCSGQTWREARQQISGNDDLKQFMKGSNGQGYGQYKTEGAKQNQSHITMFTASELMNMELPEPRYAVSGIWTQGVNILAGPPKLGKSLQALSLCLAVASGGRAYGQIPVEQGRVLYLALEDTLRRLQDRIKQMTIHDRAAPEALHLATRWDRGDRGIDGIENWLQEHTDSRMIVIDTLFKIRSRNGNKYNLYDEDYLFIEKLKTIADQHSVTMLVIHHTRKSDDEDVFNTVSGTLGLVGGADTIGVFRRSRGQADGVLYLTGRDIEEKEIALRFDNVTLQWMYLGDAQEYEMSKERRQIIELLHKCPKGLPPKEIAKILNKDGDAIRKLLSKMKHDNQVACTDGKYTITVHSGPNSHGGHNGHSGHTSSEHDDTCESVNNGRSQRSQDKPMKIKDNSETVTGVTGVNSETGNFEDFGLSEEDIEVVHEV